MEWFVFAAPVPGVVEFHAAGGVSVITGLLVALTPVVLAVRQRFGLNKPESQGPQLRVIEGGKELSRRAA